MPPSISNELPRDTSVSSEINVTRSYGDCSPKKSALSHSMSQMKEHVNSLKEVLSNTNSLLKTSKIRIQELDIQKAGAIKEQSNAKKQLIVPLSAQISFEDVVGFYKKKLNIADPKREDLIQKIDDLDDVISVIDEELDRAYCEESKLSESSSKLKNDIASIEKSIEDEQTEKLNVIEKYEMDRQDILKVQEVEAMQSAIKIAELQKKLNQCQDVSDTFMKEQEYEAKISELQGQLNAMTSKLQLTQNELSKELNSTRESLKNATRKNRTEKYSLENYEEHLCELKNKLTEKDKKMKSDEKVSHQKISAYAGAIDSLMQQIAEKDKTITVLDNRVKKDNETVRTLKNDLVERGRMLERKNSRIVSLENEVKSLQEQMREKEKEAEKKMVDLRVEMTKKLTKAEVGAALKIKDFEMKMKERMDANEIALAKKDKIVADYEKQTVNIEDVIKDKEQEANVRLNFMKEHMAQKLIEAEEAAGAALSAATQKLTAIMTEQDDEIAKKNALISYLEVKILKEKNASNNPHEERIGPMIKKTNSIFSSKSKSKSKNNGELKSISEYKSRDSSSGYTRPNSIIHVKDYVSKVSSMSTLTARSRTKSSQ